MNSIEWLSRLISFDTTSRHSNLNIIQCIQDWMLLHGAECRLTEDAKEPKANLFATIPGKKGSRDGGIILSGHTDVVPVDGQEWLTPPFEATLKDNKIFGRGASDMKGFLAVMLALVPKIKKMNLAQPVHFAFSYDEEVGCRGAPLLIADLQAAGIHPRACIVGEPTDMQPVIGHKGIQLFRCRLHGHAAHSSLVTQGCNAIEYAAQLTCYLRGIADNLRLQGPFDQNYTVPFTSLTTNMMHGGIAHNTIPELCELMFEFRHLSLADPAKITAQIEHYIKEDLLPKMKQEYGQADIELHKEAAVPAFEMVDEGQAIAHLCDLLGAAEKSKVAFATEAGLFQQAAIPSIVCGPGSIEQAHRANEFVEVKQLEMCERFLMKVFEAA